MEILKIKIKEYNEQEINDCFSNASKMIDMVDNGGKIDRNMFKVIADTLDKYSDKYSELQEWSTFFETLSFEKIPLGKSFKALKFFAVTYWKQKMSEMKMREMVSENEK